MIQTVVKDKQPYVLIVQNSNIHFIPMYVFRMFLSTVTLLLWIKI